MGAFSRSTNNAELPAPQSLEARQLRLVHLLLSHERVTEIVRR